MSRREPRKGGATGGIIHTRRKKPRKQADGFVFKPIHTANMTVRKIEESDKP